MKGAVMQYARSPEMQGRGRKLLMQRLRKGGPE